MQSSTLTGKRLLLTRAQHQIAELESKVRRAGAIPVPFPCLEFRPLPETIRHAFAHLQPHDDVAFSSANGVEHTALAAPRNLAGLLHGHRTAAVGERTAAQLRKHGVEPHIIPQTASQEGLIDAYREQGIPERLVFFRAEEGNDALQTFLESHGCKVDMVPTYRSTCPEADASEIVEALKRDAIDAVLLGSPKTARHYMQRIGDPDVANRAVIAVISPAVAKAAEKLGLHVQVVAKAASFDAILDGLQDFFADLIAEGSTRE